MKKDCSVVIAVALSFAMLVTGVLSTSSMVLAKDISKAVALSDRSNELMLQGRYAEAAALAQQVVNLVEKKLGPNHPQLATSLDNLGTLYFNMGRLAEAEPLHKRALAIREKALGPSDPALARPLNNLAKIYNNQDRIGEAVALLERSLTISEKSVGPSHPEVANCLSILAATYFKQSRYADAESLFRRVLAIVETDARFYANTLSNLAVVVTELGRADEAVALQERSVLIFEKAAGRNNPKIIELLTSLGNSYFDQGRYAEAEGIQKRAVEIAKAKLGADHPYLASSLNNLANAYSKLGKLPESLERHKQALDIQRRNFGDDHPDTISIRNNLAYTYHLIGRHAEALSTAGCKAAMAKVGGIYCFPIIKGAENAALIGPTDSFADSFLTLQLTFSSSADEAVKKLAQRIGSGSDTLAILVREDQDLETEAVRLDRALVAAVSKPPKERDGAAEERFRKRLAEIGDLRALLGERLSKEFSDYVALSKPEPLTLAETQGLLANDEAIIAFFIQRERSYAWVVTKTEGFWTEIPANSKNLSEHVEQLRASIASQDPDVAVLAHKIYQSTFGPIADKIAGKTRLSIVTNGALTSIPLGVLVSAPPEGKSLKDVDWLLKSYAITVLPSIYSLKTLRAQTNLSTAPKPMIAFADPVFSKTARTAAKTQQVAIRSLASFYRGTQIDMAALGEALPQLEGTRQEVVTIANSLSVDAADIKLGLDATEASVKEGKLDQFRIVYFATHGLVAGDLEKLSKAKAEPALVLTIPDEPSGNDDGLLQASEIAELRLNADWVVLSACNTASSDGVGAEPLSGLARAFLYAGGRSLLVSHWEVDDVATATLMSSLFALTKNKPNLSHGEMLREASLQLLNAATTNEEAHPRIWAPFVVVGEPLRTGP